MEKNHGKLKIFDCKKMGMIGKNDEKLRKNEQIWEENVEKLKKNEGNWEENVGNWEENV